MSFAKVFISCLFLTKILFTASNTYNFFSVQNLTCYPNYLLDFQGSAKLLKLRPLKDFLEYLTTFQLKIINVYDINVLRDLHKDNYIYFKILGQLTIGDVDYSESASIDDFILGSVQNQDLFLEIQLYLNSEPRSAGKLNLRNGSFFINSSSTDHIDRSIFRSAKINLSNLITLRDGLLAHKESLLDMHFKVSQSICADKESDHSVLDFVDIRSTISLDLGKLVTNPVDDEFIQPQTRR